jgi:hypothetical protein
MCASVVGGQVQVSLNELCVRCRNRQCLFDKCSLERHGRAGGRAGGGFSWGGSVCYRLDAVRCGRR